MKNHFIFIICLFFLSCSTKEEKETALKDSTITINLDSIYNSPGRGFTILYPITGMADSLRGKIVYPDLSGFTDTTFAYIFFTGENKGAIENGVCMLVGNYALSSPLICVDYNNDLDFSEAIEPIPFSEKFTDIIIPDINDHEKKFTIRFHKPEPEKKQGMREMLELYITKGEKFTDFFMDERRNIRVGDFVYQKDSLRIGLVDYDVNGAYNDIGTDRIVFGIHGGAINGIEEAEGAIILDSINYFQGKTIAFEVKKVTKDGKSMSIQPTVAKNVEARIKEGSFISDYKFKLISGEETSVKKLLVPKKYLYLNFWATWCAGCKQEVDDLKKLYADFSDQVTIVSLNFNESADKTKIFVAHNVIKWLNGISTAEINEELFIDGLPRNILIDPEGRIIEMNIHPSKLVKRLEEL